MAANETSQEKVQTREEIKKIKRQEKATKKAQKANRAPSRVRIRLLPIWLRLIIVILLVAASLVSGVMVGYGVLGDGNPKDALKKETWTHIVDLVTKE